MECKNYFIRMSKGGLLSFNSPDLLSLARIQGLIAKIKKKIFDLGGIQITSTLNQLSYEVSWKLVRCFYDKTSLRRRRSRGGGGGGRRSERKEGGLGREFSSPLPRPPFFLLLFLVHPTEGTFEKIRPHELLLQTGSTSTEEIKFIFIVL